MRDATAEMERAVNKLRDTQDQLAALLDELRENE
jgi:hypothetical protein